MKCPDTKSKVMANPSNIVGRFNCAIKALAEGGVTVGKEGKRTTINNNKIHDKALIKKNALRQSHHSPIKTPNGIPTTEAAATPPKIIDVAKLTCADATKRGAIPPAIAHIMPIHKPINKRLINSNVK